MCIWKVFYILNLYSIWRVSMMGFPGGSVVKNPHANGRGTGDVGSNPGLGRSPERGNGNPLQYSYLKNFTDRIALWATVHSITKSQTWLSERVCTNIIYTSLCRDVFPILLDKYLGEEDCLTLEEGIILLSNVCVCVCVCVCVFPFYSHHLTGNQWPLYQKIHAFLVLGKFVKAYTA